MCGIVGLFTKTSELEANLGALLAPMLAEMSERGPDSAGVAIYRRPAPQGFSKAVVFSPRECYPWEVLVAALESKFGGPVGIEARATHRVLIVPTSAPSLIEFLSEYDETLRIMSAGESIEIFKEKGSPDDVIRRFALDQMDGSHALGHTRMATESAVTTGHSHPFSTGLDLCLVHNGSLSNHNRLRRRLTRQGVEFQTDNDTEVAAGYLTWQLGQGASIHEALEASVKDLDGFYTFAVGTRAGFAVLRDPIACKPAVLAETGDWVAMASEFRAIAVLPGAEQAHIWEPEPGQVYSWDRAAR